MMTKRNKYSVTPQCKDKYYVYALCRPNGLPFYVGKGKGERINDHFKPSNLKVNSPKTGKIKHYGNQVKREILCYFNDEQKAYEYEEWLISTYGLESEGGILVNYAKTRFEYSDKFVEDVSSKGGKSRFYNLPNDIVFKILKLRFYDAESVAHISEVTKVSRKICQKICRGERNKALYEKYITSGLIRNNLKNGVRKKARKSKNYVSNDLLVQLLTDYYDGKIDRYDFAKAIGKSQQYVLGVLSGTARKVYGIELQDYERLDNTQRPTKTDEYIIDVLDLRFNKNMSYKNIVDTLKLPKTTVARICTFSGRYEKYKATTVNKE